MSPQTLELRFHFLELFSAVLSKPYFILPQGRGCLTQRHTELFIHAVSISVREALLY